ncbi:hypothetical protein [Aestuariimicrobium sp. Y1814]|uniref:hypothetical protein n=1 Tax=Aestuariimicrobium sp. Y1814 TaxID=3418742 RepID=UPI003DA72F72
MSYPPQSPGSGYQPNSATPPPSWEQQAPQGWNQQGQQAPQGWNQPGPQVQPSAQDWGQGQQAWGQDQGWNQQGQQQGWGQQGWDQGHPQAWATTPQPKKANTGLVAILVAVAVLVAGVGVWALTNNRNGAEPTVEAFFELLNTQQPSYREFSWHVTGIDYKNVYDATRHHPGGTWSLISVGEATDDKVSVTWKHNEQEYTHDFELRKEGDRTKLYKPFSYVTFTSQSRVRFVLNPGDDVGVFLNQQVALFPGSYTITPIPSYTGSEPIWEPAEPTLDMAPGVIQTLDVGAKLTEDADAKFKKAVVDAFNECIASTSFYPPSCPFRADPRPTDSLGSQAKWSATPSDAANNAAYVETSGIDQPCYQFTAQIRYSYQTREGVVRESNAADLTMTGCVYASLSSNRVTWQR